LLCVDQHALGGDVLGLLRQFQLDPYRRGTHM
jgi:hypothetical protein